MYNAVFVKNLRDMVAHAYNPSPWEAEVGGLLWATLGYKVSS